MFITLLIARNDEEGNTFVEGLCIKDIVNESCREGGS